MMGATGESVRRVTDFGFNPAWSPEGGAIAFATEGIEETGMVGFSKASCGSVTLATGETRRIEVKDAVQPHWSPGGHRIAFWGVPTTGSGRRDLWTVSATGGKGRCRSRTTSSSTGIRSGRPRATGSSSLVIAAAP